MALFFLFQLQTLKSQDRPDWVDGFPDGCTSITCGKKATADGSVITSHTDDSHRTRSEILVEPAKKHHKGSMQALYKRVPCDTLAMPTYSNIKIGEIPQVEIGRASCRERA